MDFGKLAWTLLRAALGAQPRPPPTPANSSASSDAARGATALLRHLSDTSAGILSNTTGPNDWRNPQRPEEEGYRTRMGAYGADDRRDASSEPPA